MTGRIRRGGNDRGGWQNTRDPQAPLDCPSCGLRNDASARFCRNCGLPLGWPQDPVRGTTTRRADLPSERGTGLATVVGLIAAIAVLGVAAFLILRPSNPATGVVTPTRTPATSSRPGGSASPGAGTSPIAGSPGQPSVLPGESGQPSAEPSEATTEPPGTFPASVEFTCDPADLGDPTQSRWHVSHVNWLASRSWDEVIIDLSRDGGGSRAGAMTIESMTLDEVSGRIGMNPPPDADRAVVLTMDRRFVAPQRSPIDTGMAIIKNITIGKGSDDLWHFVLGVSGDGCHRAGVAAWDQDPTAQEVQLIIDVRRQ